MTRRTNDFRFALIALAAVVAILSFGGDATAQTATSSARKAVRSCCSSRVCPAGCCSPRSTAADSSVGDRLPLPATRSARMTGPPSSCECQSDEPAAPASRPESEPVGGRPAEELNEVASLPIPPTYPGLVARLIERDPWPPGSPLYLATSRLLI